MLWRSKKVLALIFVLILSAPSAVCAAEKAVIGTEGAYAPFNFVDEKGVADGYDVAVARAVDELVPEIEFSFEPTDWDSIFVALESGRFDIIVSTISKTAEREKKYLFSDLPYLYYANAIFFKGGRTDIKSVKDLHGKTAALGIGTANTIALEKYNEENGNPIKVVYTDGELSKTLQEIINGRADVFLANPVSVNQFTKEQGLDVGYIIWQENGIEPLYFLFANNERGKRYKKLVDPALKTLLENGTLAKISRQYLGADYSTEKALLEQNAK
jgi:L-cystine transport system substrate-binding protein